jgi:His-Xaa-Ser system protein HxsD
MESVPRQDEEDRHKGHSPELAAGLVRTSPPELRAWTLTGAQIAVDVDLSVYSLDAVLRAGYKFTDRCYVFLSRDEAHDGHLIAVLTPKHRELNLESVVGQFSNELLDQRLRETLEAQFGDLRTLIVAQAFSEGNLLDPMQDDGDYQTDPRGAGRRR